MKSKAISVVSMVVFLTFAGGCTHIKTGQRIDLGQINTKKTANRISLAILLSDLAKADSGFKEKAATVVSQLSKHLASLEDGKFTLDEAFDRIRSVSDKQGKPLVDPKISVIVKLALEDELTGYLEIPKGHNEKLQKLIEVVRLVNRKLNFPNRRKDLWTLPQ